MLYLSDIYPNKVDEDEYPIIACTLHYYVSKMYDESINISCFAPLYGVDEEKCVAYLEDLERACSI